jgi:hypothetical protein
MIYRLSIGFFDEAIISTDQKNIGRKPNLY